MARRCATAVVAISDRQVARGRALRREISGSSGPIRIPPARSALARQWQSLASGAAQEPEDDRVMAIQGVITTNDVLRHPVLIVAQFGFGTYFRCCKAIVLGQRTTFLACAFG